MKINIAKSGLGVRGIRVMLGIPGHKASAHAKCVGARLKGQTHPAAPAGAGGKENVGWRATFVAASQACGREVPKVPRR